MPSFIMDSNMVSVQKNHTHTCISYSMGKCRHYAREQSLNNLILKLCGDEKYTKEQAYNTQSHSDWVFILLVQ
jgi:hypothetical protein